MKIFGINIFTQKSFNRKKAGMTLFEVIVAIVIVGIVFSMVMASYASLVKTQTKANVARQLQKEVNFALIRMGDKIRDGSIDYQAYDGGECDGVDLGSAPKLCVGGGLVFTKESGILTVNGKPLISQRFAVDKLYFFTTPNEDPSEEFGGEQPKVTIFFEMYSRQETDIRMEIQTTISSRKYN